MAVLFIQLLILVTIRLCVERKFLGSIVFLVYVGGIMVLIGYCVILMPVSKYPLPLLCLLPLLVVLLRTSPENTRSALPYGLQFSAGAYYILRILLFLVLLAVVGIIDYSRGMMKT